MFLRKELFQLDLEGNSILLLKGTVGPTEALAFIVCIDSIL